MLGKLFSLSFFLIFALSVTISICSAVFLAYGGLFYGFTNLVGIPICKHAAPSVMSMSDAEDGPRKIEPMLAWMREGFRIAIVSFPVGSVITLLLGFIGSKMGVIGDNDQRPRSKEGWLFYIPQKEKP